MGENDTRLKIGIVILLVVSGILFYRFFASRNTANEIAVPRSNQPAPVAPGPTPVQSKIIVEGGDGKMGVLAYKDQGGKDQQQPLNEYQKNFALLAKTIFEMAVLELPKENFVAELQKLGLRPIIAQDKQEVIEDLTIIRTENSLPGVRYIHAQYDGDGEQELQHLSFEIPKGPNALNEAANLLSKILPLPEPLKDTDPAFKKYKMGKYVMWMKVLDHGDIHGDPFNLYVDADVGNIRVAIERDIHPHEGGHDEHGEH